MSEKPHMDLDEAVSIAQRMKNLFRAFERLEEVLQLARVKESDMSNALQVVNKLIEEKEGLEATVNGLKQTEKEAKEDAAKAVSEANATKKKYKQQLDQELAEIKKRAEIEKAELNATMNNAVRKHDKEISDMKDAKQANQLVLDSLTEKISALKNQMTRAAEGLGDEPQPTQ